MSSDHPINPKNGGALLSGVIQESDWTRNSEGSQRGSSNDPWSGSDWEGAVFSDRYEVHQKIGMGGMGVVYSAYDRQRNHEIAIKVLAANLLSDAKAQEQFRREAQITSDLSHPNIVNVYGFQRDGEIAFLTMELLAGKTLRQVIRERRKEGHRFSIEEAKRLVLQLCDALEYAHHFTVHRDVKPENVWIQPDGTLKLMDFGLAGLLLDRERSHAGLTRSGVSLGTPYFMAPEQLRGLGKVDARADQYSTAVLFYELLTGEIVAGMANSVRKLRAEVPEGLSRAIHRALSAHPDERFPDMRTFAAAIRTDGEPLRWMPKSKKGVALAVASIMTVAMLLFFSTERLIASWRQAGIRLDATRIEARNLAEILLKNKQVAAKNYAEFLNANLSDDAKLEGSLDSELWSEIDQKMRSGHELLLEQNKEEHALRAFQSAQIKLEQLDSNTDQLQKFIVAERKAKESTQFLAQSAAGLIPSDDLPAPNDVLNQARQAVAKGQYSLGVDLLNALNNRLAQHGAAVATSSRADAQASKAAWDSSFRADSIPTLKFDGNPDSLVKSAESALIRQSYALAGINYQQAKEIYSRWKSDLDDLHRRTDQFLETSVPDAELRTNSLGMRFVRVSPSLWVSIWETRVIDFDVFVRRADEWNQHPDPNWWKHLKVTPSPTHPAVGISFPDAVHFNGWLASAEWWTGEMERTWNYDLCSEEDWDEIERALSRRLSRSAGAMTIPGWKGVYAWGTHWPPIDKSGGHYGDPGLRRETFIQSVANSRPNALGLFDFEGNAWEWMLGIYDYGGRVPTDSVGHAYLNQFMGGGPFGELTSGHNWNLKQNYVPVGLIEAMGFRIVLRVQR
ncbi:MAG: bifunctional serine/threonine-protein kinase/formylglycine-generating enzyme family protein [Verrucomicrobia bacterium]|nr:bifunctional serine/threonine-protein kinase/formylglycine-generating enzyme family protein [Verrucomicrobiota bacterium]